MRKYRTKFWWWNEWRSIFSYEFPSIHIEGIANNDNEELYKENFLYIIPECLVILLIESKNKKYIDFVIEFWYENIFCLMI
jgi:hypothetical protein